jgi:hypothetical protein
MRDALRSLSNLQLFFVMRDNPALRQAALAELGSRESFIRVLGES